MRLPGLSLHSLLATCLLILSTHSFSSVPGLDPRQIPANATGVKTIKSPTGATIRYKEPGKEGICEITPGVNSYSGYVDLAEDSHTFFWFFEARHQPETAPLTLWLNGGPGSDSLLGLFQELGPCNVTIDNKTEINPWSWSEVSNLLFISQPLGTGFSYAHEEPGAFNAFTLEHENSSYGVTGEWPIVNASEQSTTELAAAATWHVLQGFLSALPQLDGKVKSRSFNLWTESYGGHYGPAFFKYFYHENKKIANGTANGTQLTFDTLGIGNGIVNLYTQAPHYPRFAMNNTYGIKTVNETVHDYMQFALNMNGGCLDLALQCAQANRSTDVGMQYCFQATDQCRTNVEGPYYSYSKRGVYDIRHPYGDPTPPTYFESYLNIPKVQNALGVNLNYTRASSDVSYAFQKTGDYASVNFTPDLEYLLNNSVRVALYYGDADYICNWFGGEAVSLNISYTHTKQFRNATYVPFVVDGQEYGEVRQYGNFSFLRMYEAGHEVPFYQPQAALEMFRRTLGNQDIATGNVRVDSTYDTEGGETKAEHTEGYVPIPSRTGSPVLWTIPITRPLVTVELPSATESVSSIGAKLTHAPVETGVEKRFLDYSERRIIEMVDDV